MIYRFCIVFDFQADLWMLSGFLFWFTLLNVHVYREIKSVILKGLKSHLEWWSSMKLPVATPP